MIVVFKTETGKGLFVGIKSAGDMGCLYAAATSCEHNLATYGSSKRTPTGDGNCS